MYLQTIIFYCKSEVLELFKLSILMPRKLGLLDVNKVVKLSLSKQLLKSNCGRQLTVKLSCYGFVGGISAQVVVFTSHAQPC